MSTLPPLQQVPMGSGLRAKLEAARRLVQDDLSRPVNLAAVPRGFFQPQQPQPRRRPQPAGGGGAPRAPRSAAAAPRSAAQRTAAPRSPPCMPRPNPAGRAAAAARSFTGAATWQHRFPAARPGRPADGATSAAYVQRPAYSAGNPRPVNPRGHEYVGRPLATRAATNTNGRPRPAQPTRAPSGALVAGALAGGGAGGGVACFPSASPGSGLDRSGDMSAALEADLARQYADMQLQLSRWAAPPPPHLCPHPRSCVLACRLTACRARPGRGGGGKSSCGSCSRRTRTSRWRALRAGTTFRRGRSRSRRRRPAPPTGGTGR